MIPTVTLREAHWRDIPDMARVEEVSFPDDAWSSASFWSELAQRPRRSYLVATEPGARPGDGVLGQAGLDLAGDVADVMTVAVDPAARGRGVGALLLDALHARAREAGAGTVLLEVRADNDAARGLYQSRGYAVLRTRPGYYRRRDGAPPVDALIMSKELTT